MAENYYKFGLVTCEILAYATRIKKSPLECNQNCEDCPFVNQDEIFPKKSVLDGEQTKTNIEPEESLLLDMLQLIEGKIRNR